MTTTKHPVTEAVVLAAGCGSRLESQSQGVPKPLVEVAGKRLIERTIGALAFAGVTRVVVVTGFRAGVLQEGLRSVQVPGVVIDTVVNERWEEPNGLSLYCARDALKTDRFFLTMSDHVFDRSIVADLAAHGVPDGGVCLGVDTDTDGIFDIDDATKVLLDADSRIVEIDKKLKDYNAIDTGIFLCTPGIFGALETAFDAGRMSLSDGMRELGRRGLFTGMPIGGRYWQDVDDAPMFAKAEQDILAGRLPTD